jgi:hypothetical protein
MQHNLYNPMTNIHHVNKYDKYTLEQLTNQELEDESEVDWGQAVGEEEICRLGCAEQSQHPRNVGFHSSTQPTLTDLFIDRPKA